VLSVDVGVSVRQAGLYVMTLFDWYAGGLNVIIVALFEVCGVAWIYGALYEFCGSMA